MIFITNFNISRNLADVKYSFDNYGKTNIDELLDSFVVGYTSWSVPKNAKIGDTVVFMCAATARNNLGLATSHIPPSYGKEFISFVNQQKALYKQYSGCLLGFGIVASLPQFDPGSHWWFSDINNIRKFSNPVSIDAFRSFVFISRTGANTILSDDQWGRLQWEVNQKNPGFFTNAVAPDASTLEEEFEEEVKKEAKKSLNDLKKAAVKKASKPTASTVQTKVYNRNSTIAAYAKKRANGICQLCGQPAPFADQNGEPYLECHHIDWLSKGGMDSADNCVALCPNCHKKMHIINDKNDIALLKTKVK